jgi:hypothetical protein
MQDWVNCTISVGQFSGEYGVQGCLFNGRPFSLFAQEKDVMFNEPPQPGKPVTGRICAEIIEKKDDLVLVALPESTFENGRTITVRANQIK